MKGKISIIMPVYNAAAYMHRMIEAVLAQTYKNIELLFVNDGSTDETKSICERYVNEHADKVRLVSLDRNSGISAARNAGVAATDGDFFAFVDSDDFILPDMFEVLANAMELTSADVVRCEAYNVPWEETPDKLPKNEEDLSKMAEAKGWKRRVYPDELLDNRAFLEDCLTHSRYTSVNTALWRRGAVGDLVFLIDMRYNEDYKFWMDFISKSERRIYSIKKAEYIRYLRMGSHTSKGATEKHLCEVRSAVSLLDSCKKWDCDSYIYFLAFEIMLLRAMKPKLVLAGGKMLYTDDMQRAVDFLYKDRALIRQCDKLNWRGKLVSRTLLSAAKLKQWFHKKTT